MTRSSLAALALAVAVLVLGIRFGSRAGAGSDCYGYVSQADLWLHRQLVIEQPWVARFSWPNADAVFAPLGYRPGVRPHTLVPTYPPGLPLLMAAFSLVGGSVARYLVVPLMAAIGVWLTSRLGRLALGEAGGLLAAVLLASSPAFLFEAMFPMSDVPAMTFWLAASLLVLRAQPHGAGRTPGLAGLAASAAILVRPNLAPLALVLAVSLLLDIQPRRDSTAGPGSAGVAGGGADWRGRWRDLSRFAAGVVPGVAAYAAFNAALYGSPVKSGYGGFSSIFTLQDPAGTLAHYARLLVETQTVLVVFALPGCFTIRAHDAAKTWPLRFLLAGTVATVLGIYAFYTRFEEWWYLRFLLPAFPALIISSLAGLRWVVADVARSSRFASIVLVCACLLAAAWGWQVVVGRGLFHVRRDEGRYDRIAASVRKLTPPNAAILCMQHSGTLRYYGSRVTARFDVLAPDMLDRAVGDLRGAGYHPYFLLEDWELPLFRDRFGSLSPLGRLDWSPLVRVWPSPAVFLYDAADVTAAPSPAASR